MNVIVLKECVKQSTMHAEGPITAVWQVMRSDEGGWHLFLNLNHGNLINTPFFSFGKQQFYV